MASSLSALRPRRRRPALPIALLGLLIVLMGACLAIYFGVYVCIFGGIVGIISGIKAGWVAAPIAWGVIKIMFAGVLSGIIFLTCTTVGGALMTRD